MLLVAVYGSLDTALKEMRPSAATELGWAAFFASCPASFVGAFLAPLVLGTVTRQRLAVVLSSVAGAAVATALAVVFGGLAGWFCWHAVPRSMAFAWVAFALSVPAGIGGGLIGGWILRRAKPDATAAEPAYEPLPDVTQNEAGPLPS